MEKELVTALDQPTGSIKRLTQFLSNDHVRQSLTDLMADDNAIRRLSRVASLAISRQPKLLQCTIGSIVGAIAESVRLGLEIGDYRGSMYITPRRMTRKDGSQVYEACASIEYQGMIQLAYRVPGLQSIYADVVFENDAYEFQLGTDAYLKHVPKLDGDRGEKLFAYAYIAMNGGAKILHIVDKINVERHRACSDNPNGSIWTTHAIWGWRKTAIWEIAKFLPQCDAVNVIERDSAASAGKVTGRDMLRDLAPDLFIEGEFTETTEPQEQELNKEEVKK